VRTAALCLAVALSGCYSYTGGARGMDPAKISIDEGWIVAGQTPLVRQHGPIDCGPAALAMIAGHWDVSLSVEGAVAALPKPAPEGSSLGDLRDLARARGLTAYAITGDHVTLIHELRAGRPVLIGLYAPYGKKYVQSHYEVLVALRPDESEYVTLDPARGWRVRSWKDLDAEWKRAGRPALFVRGPAAETTAASATR
jgi:ABC-type bacteriocin/lantibiotic exporter with double-glycine peptidase domain